MRVSWVAGVFSCRRSVRASTTGARRPTQRRSLRATETKGREGGLSEFFLDLFQRFGSVVVVPNDFLDGRWTGRACIVDLTSFPFSRSLAAGGAPGFKDEYGSELLVACCGSGRRPRARLVRIFDVERPGRDGRE